MGKREVAQGLQSLSNTFLQLGALEQRKQELGMQKQKMKEFLTQKKLEKAMFLLSYANKIKDPTKAENFMNISSNRIAELLSSSLGIPVTPDDVKDSVNSRLWESLIKYSFRQTDENDPNVRIGLATYPEAAKAIMQIRSMYELGRIPVSIGGDHISIGTAVEEGVAGKLGGVFRPGEGGILKYEPKTGTGVGGIGSLSTNQAVQLYKEFNRRYNELINVLANNHPDWDSSKISNAALFQLRREAAAQGINPKAFDRIMNVPNLVNQSIDTETANVIPTQAGATETKAVTPPSLPQETPQEQVTPQQAVNEQVTPAQKPVQQQQLTNVQEKPVKNTDWVKYEPSKDMINGDDLVKNMKLTSDERKTVKTYTEAVNMAIQLFGAMKKYYTKRAEQKQPKTMIGKFLNRIREEAYKLTEKWKLGDGLWGSLTRMIAGDPDADYADFDSLTKSFVEKTMKAVEGGRPSDKDREYIASFLPSTMQTKEVNFIRLRNWINASRGSMMAFYYSFMADPTKSEADKAKLKAELVDKLNYFDNLMKVHEAFFLNKQLKSKQPVSTREEAVAADLEQNERAKQYLKEAFSKEVNYNGQTMTRYQAFMQLNKDLGGRVKVNNLIEEAYKRGILTAKDDDAGTVISAFMDKSTLAFVDKMFSQGGQQ